MDSINTFMNENQYDPFKKIKEEDQDKKLMFIGLGILGALIISTVVIVVLKKRK